jgi:uncharacterized membrane protein
MTKKRRQSNLPVPSNPATPQKDPQSGQNPEKSAPEIIAVSASKTEVFSGPLPPPEYLEKYERVHPGAAQQIFTTFERLTTHQIEMEKQALSSETGRATLGVAAGFVIAMTLIIGGVFCICLGHDWAGATIIVSCVATLAGVFVHGRVQKKKGQGEKQSEHPDE